MTTVQVAKPNRRGKRSAASGGVDSPLAALYERQRDAVDAARAEGVHEIEVCFRTPGSSFIAKVKVEDLEQLTVLRQSKKPEDSTRSDDRVPTEKLRKAMEEAKGVTIFYKTPEELFDALEKQD